MTGLHWPKYLLCHLKKGATNHFAIAQTLDTTILRQVEEKELLKHQKALSFHDLRQLSGVML